MYHVANGDYLALWQDAAALHFMSHYCVCCDEHFEFDEAAQHISQHWSHITQLPACAYDECADKFMANFRVLPWFQNIPCYQAILHQVLLTRLLVELWTDGAARFRDAGHLAERLAQRRIDQGLQTATFRGGDDTEKKQRSGVQQRSRSRSKHHRTSTPPGTAGNLPRGFHSGDVAATTVYLTPQKRTRKHSPGLDVEKSGMALGDRQIDSATLLSSPTDDGDPSRTCNEADPSLALGRDLQGQLEAEHGVGGWELSIPELEPSIKEAGGEQRQSSDSLRTQGNHGGHHPNPSGDLPCVTLSCPEETSSRPRSSSQCGVSVGHDSDPGPSQALAEIVLSQHLASRGCGSEETNSKQDTTGKASGTAPTPATLRICTNRPGLYCWLNSILIALCWQGLVTMYPLVAWIDTCWAFRELTKFTLAPLALHFGDASFDELMRDWVSRHNWLAQQDAVDFLCYLLPILRPCFYCGKWLPKWSAEQPTAIDDAENDEKGDAFAPIMISICLPVSEFTLQDFISWWHDVSGHQRVMLGTPLGTCIYLDRMQHEPSYHKDSREVYLSDFCLLPCYIEGQIQWISYHLIGVTYHTGDDYQRGHWQSSLWQSPPYQRWLHYDDGKVPTQSITLIPHIHQNWCLAWFALDPHYN